MKKPIRVLHYIPGFKFGGIESRFMDIFSVINHDEFQFDIMVLTSSENTMLKTFKEGGGNVYVMPPLSLNAINKHIKEVKKFFEEHEYDIVHCYSPMGYFVLKFAKVNGVKGRILHARSSSFGGSSAIWLRNILKVLTRKQANIYLAVSNSSASWLFGNSKEVEIIKNSIEVAKFEYNERIRLEIRKQNNISNQFIVGHVGRYTYAKNHEFVLKVFKEILELHPNSRLLLVGTTIKDVEEQAEKLKITNKITAVGFQNDVSHFYQSMDALLFPSFYEGLPGTLLEAQVSGLKCFVSNTITKEVDVTPEIYFLDLNSSSKEWAKIIIEHALDYNRQSQTNEIEESGFELKSSVNRLEEIYKSYIMRKTD
ncbi:glycosyltransferase [Bacillus sp. CRN 9]|nr:glycosyltransferase [Bacillus sp. CRN 9]